MVIYFNTVRRKRPVKEGGELIQLDWSKKKILKTLPLYPSDPDILEDPNPRGNSRGGKGILVRGDEIFVGTYHTILVYDLDLNLKRRLTNPNFVNIHEICADGDNTWVSATTIDAALLVDKNGKTLESWWPREEPLLQERFGLVPMEIDKKADNRLRYLHRELSLKESHTHLNSLVHNQGRTLALLNRLGALVQIKPAVKVLVEDRLLRGAHSPVILTEKEQIAVCSSFRKHILFYDLHSGELTNTIDLLSFPKIARYHKKYPDQPFNKSLFVRGLEKISEHRLLVGVAPAAILEIDTRKKRLIDLFQYSKDVGDGVHGLVHIKKK